VTGVPIAMTDNRELDLDINLDNGDVYVISRLKSHSVWPLQHEHLLG
jgi:hypothetical protein